MWSTLIQTDWEIRSIAPKRFENTIFHHSRANNFHVTGRISLIIKLILDLVPINTSCKFGPDWLRNQVSIMLTRFKTAIFNNSRANNFRVSRLISLIIKLIWDLVPINTLCNFGPDWLTNVVSDCANKVKNSNFQSFRANNSGVTGRISLIIELIWDLLPINTSCKLWSRLIGQCGLYCANKKKVNGCMDAHTDELPWHKHL